MASSQQDFIEYGQALQKIKELQDQLRFSNDLIGVHQAEERVLKAHMQTLEDGSKRLRVAEKLMSDMIILESDPAFEDLRTEAQRQFPIGHLLAQVLSGNLEEGQKAIDALQTFLHEASRATSVSSRQQLPVLDEKEIAKRVDTSNEDRVRAIARDLYERSLTLPRRLSELYDQFILARTRFQHLLGEREHIVDDLLERKIDARLSVQRTRVERSLPLVETGALQSFNQLVTVARTSLARLNAINQELEGMLVDFDRVRDQYFALCTSASELRRKAEHAKQMCSLFALPCPTEISRQFDETVARLLFSDDETDHARRRVFIAFQPFIPDFPHVVATLFESLLSAERLLLGLSNTSPDTLFSDKPTQHEAIARLFLLAAHVCNKPEAERFRTKNTLVSVLQKSGLVHAEKETLGPIADAQKPHFEVKQVFRYSVWIPKTSCRTLATQYAELLVQKDVVLEAIRFGQRKHYEERYAEKDKTASGNDDEE